MDYINLDLKNGNWDRLSDPINIVKSYIDVIELGLNTYVKFRIRVVPPSIIDKFGMSIFNMVFGNPDVKAYLFEIPFTQHIRRNPDILIGFIPHPDATDIVNVKVMLEPNKKSFLSLFFKDNQCVEWHCQIQPKKYKEYTPFLYGAFPFPKMSYINWSVKITCESTLKPLILCANVQTKERKQLAESNIYLPISRLVPKLNKYVDRNTMILQYI
jgi:hypothetical protein